MLSQEHRAAVELASEAGGALMELRARSEPGRELGTRAISCHNGCSWTGWPPGSPPIGSDRRKQTAPSGSTDASGRVWIIDPLDGTREYSEGREDWAVHVALAIDGVARVGGVALPAMDVVLGTEDPPVLAAPAVVPRLVVSRSRPPEFVPFVAERLGATTVPMGSAGAKIAAVIRGEAEVYVHAGGQYEWDSAAPVAVALATGLHAARLDGSPLRYSQPDPWLPDLVVCHPALTGAVTEALGAAGLPMQ